MIELDGEGKHWEIRKFQSSLQSQESLSGKEVKKVRLRQSCTPFFIIKEDAYYL